MIGLGRTLALSGGVLEDDLDTPEIAEVSVTCGFANVARDQMAKRILQVSVEDAWLGAELRMHDRQALPFHDSLQLLAVGMQRLERLGRACLCTARLFPAGVEQM